MDVFGPVEVSTCDFENFDVYYEGEHVASVKVDDDGAALRYLNEGFSNPDYELFMEHTEKGIDELLEKETDYRLPEQLEDYSSSSKNREVTPI